MSKESFKAFIKQKPYLAKAVLEGKTTFQKLYEVYDLYGENSRSFSEFENSKEEAKSNHFNFNEITNMFKNVDLESIQKGIQGLEKAINLVQDVVPKNENRSFPNYEERPINKYYED